MYARCTTSRCHCRPSWPLVVRLCTLLKTSILVSKAEIMVTPMQTVLLTLICTRHLIWSDPERLLEHLMHCMPSMPLRDMPLDPHMVTFRIASASARYRATCCISFQMQFLGCMLTYSSKDGQKEVVA